MRDEGGGMVRYLITRSSAADSACVEGGVHCTVSHPTVLY